MISRERVERLYQTAQHSAALYRWDRDGNTIGEAALIADSGPARVMIVPEHDEVRIVVEGTEGWGDVWRDLASLFRVYPQNLSGAGYRIGVSLGFWLQARNARRALEPLLRPCRHQDLHIEGHSLGAIAGMMLACDLYRSGFRVRNVTTLGQPRGGGLRWAKHVRAVSTLGPVSFLTAVGIDDGRPDIVTRLIPRAMPPGYQHPDFEVQPRIAVSDVPTDGWHASELSFERWQKLQRLHPVPRTTPIRRALRRGLQLLRGARDSVQAHSAEKMAERLGRDLRFASVTGSDTEFE